MEAPKRVLVCDDERHIVRLVESNLRRQGHEVTCAYDGREAVAVLERETFDWAVVDLMMPYVDGLEVLKWIRTHERSQATKVVLLSAQAGAIRDDASLLYRADLYVTKPFDPTDLFR